MKRILTLFLIVCVTTSSAVAQGVMTDQQVVDYVKNGLASGKSKNDMATELSARGVTRQQAKRAYELYQQQMAEEGNGAEAAAPVNRSHVVGGETSAVKRDNKSIATNQLDARKRDRVSSVLGQDMDGVFDDADEVPIEAETMVFGQDVFHNENLTFAPSSNMATPRNYHLGPGDQVIVDVFGANQTTLTGVISPEGSINVDVLGPVYLNGMTVEEANTYLKKRLSKIYAGIGRSSEGTDIRLSLGQIRTIQVNVLGDVTTPGTYTVSSFSTVFHALYLAGGIRQPGTLRNIKVTRGNRTVATVDVYDFLLNGNAHSDVRLEEGDVIIVPAYECMVKVNGMVKRPMFFEMKEGENLKQLINYAGGFAKGAYTNNITVTRQTGRDYEICNVDNFEFAGFEMKDGDEVEIGELVSRFENRVTVRGAVYHPGIFQLGKVNSVKELIEKCDGLLPEAFTTRALMHREHADRTLEAIPVNVASILNGTAPDIVLQNNDVLYIPSVLDLTDVGTLTIGGQVASPGTFPYAQNTTIEDLIVQAGGLLDGASYARIDVTRRIKDNMSLKAQKEISQMFTLSLQNGLVVDGPADFKLEPYDMVYVRKSPSYVEPLTVELAGEANFPGTYTLTKRNQRLTELLAQGGGLTDFAFVKGARLVRHITEIERQKMHEVYRQIFLGGDSLNNAAINLGKEYYVAIDLDKAIENPGSKYDVILRDSDRLEIPGTLTTVRVSGAIQNPNTITYEEGKSVKYYIEQAGGYADDARKRHAFVLHMNGHITKARKTKSIDPGAEIIVPMKKKVKHSLAETMAVGTTAASLATTIATIANLMK